MLSSPAQYLLRFDDLCPTIPRDRFERFLPLIEEFHLRPILAIVPDNRDPDLQLSPPDPDFWASMRALEAAGATIAIHGYRHVCASHGRSLVPLARKSEFAGVPEAVQREWIREGLNILRAHGLTPRMWVAPRHGFDRNTLRALQAEGIPALSDGLGREPFTRGGVAWIPQQLWAPREKPCGLWTICIHPHTAQSADFDELRAFLGSHAANFTSMPRVLAELRPGRLSARESAYAKLALWRIKLRRLRSRGKCGTV